MFPVRVSRTSVLQEAISSMSLSFASLLLVRIKVSSLGHISPKLDSIWLIRLLESRMLSSLLS